MVWTMMYRRCRDITEDNSNTEDTDNTKDNTKKVESGDDGVGVGKERRVDGNVTGNGGGTGSPSPFWTYLVRHR